MITFGKTQPTRWGLTIVSLYAIAALASGGHECDRECTGSSPRVCRFEWTMEVFVTMGLSCGNCPYNITDCYKINCIPANGVKRSVTVINRQMPGPAINVCQGDRIIVDLRNEAVTLSTAIHWHGQNQVRTPHMDGVSMVTQCPIHPSNIFRYSFVANEAGTHFWHSHMGFQRTDGVNGLLVVRQPRSVDPNSGTYDVDISANQMIITDWINRTGDDMFNAFYHGDEQYFPYLDTILINGHGRMAEFRNATTGTVHYTPYSSFVVKRGMRYRFRLCSNANWMCPVEVSVDRHDLLVISTDGNPVEPFRVNALVINPGERFDFVINANQNIGTYWMLFRGLFQCERMGTVGRAILKYETAMDAEPPAPARPPSPYLVLNPVNVNFTNSSHVSLLRLKSKTRDVTTSVAKADTVIYLPMDLYRNLNRDIDDPTALLALLDSTSFRTPPAPMLTQWRDIPPEYLCNEPSTRGVNCSATFCKCTYFIKLARNAIVDLVLVDEGRTNQTNILHPFHLHGHHFRLLGQNMVNDRITAQEVRRLDEQGRLVRNLDRPVEKDTFSVPHGGYAIFRFLADNPGMWAFHCHVELHMETGMMLVFQVGTPNEFEPPPPEFPRCSHFPKFLR